METQLPNIQKLYHAMSGVNTWGEWGNGHIFSALLHSTLLLYSSALGSFALLSSALLPPLFYSTLCSALLSSALRSSALLSLKTFGASLLGGPEHRIDRRAHKCLIIAPDAPDNPRRPADVRRDLVGVSAMHARPDRIKLPAMFLANFVEQSRVK